MPGQSTHAIVAALQRPLAILALLVAAFLGACGGTPNVSGTRARYPVLRVLCPVADADIFIDETYVGEVRTFPGGVKIPPGLHRIEIRHDRYHSRFYEVTLALDERRLLEVDLPEALP